MSIKEKITALEQEADDLRQLLRKFPNLKETKDRWHRSTLHTIDINNRPDLIVDSSKICGCCDGSLDIYYAYLNENHHYIFTEPRELLSWDSCEPIADNRQKILKKLENFNLNEATKTRIFNLLEKNHRQYLADRAADIGSF